MTKLLDWLKAKHKKKTPSLGERELQLLNILWQYESVTAQEIAEQLNNKVSLSTLQSTLERLYRKDIVERKKIGRSYLYTSRLSRSQLISSMMHDINLELGQGDMQAMISGFIDFVSESDQAQANKIKTLVDKKK